MFSGPGEGFDCVLTAIFLDSPHQLGGFLWPLDDFVEALVHMFQRFEGLLVPSWEPC